MSRASLVLFLISCKLLAAAQPRVIKVLNISNKQLHAKWEESRSATTEVLAPKDLSNIEDTGFGGRLCVGNDLLKPTWLSLGREQRRLVLDYDSLLERVYEKNDAASCFLLVNRSGLSIACNWEGKKSAATLASDDEISLLLPENGDSPNALDVSCENGPVLKIDTQIIRNHIENDGLGITIYLSVVPTKRLTCVVDGLPCCGSLQITNTTSERLYCTLLKAHGDVLRKAALGDVTPLEAQRCCAVHSSVNIAQEDNGLLLLVSRNKGDILVCSESMSKAKVEEMQASRDSFIVEVLGQNNRAVYLEWSDECGRLRLVAKSTAQFPALNKAQRIALALAGRSARDYNLWRIFMPEVWKNLSQLTRNEESIIRTLCSPSSDLRLFFSSYGEAKVYRSSHELAREHEYIARRMVVAQKALENLFTEAELLEAGLEKKDLEKYFPRINVVFSGGGYRAMIETLGYLSGLKEIKVLDCVLSAGCLSGSTWALFPWVHSGRDIDDFKREQKEKTYKGTLTALLRAVNREGVGQIHLDSLFGHLPGICDLYGEAVFQALVDALHHTRMSDVKLDAEKHPLPLGVAVQRVAQDDQYALGHNEKHRWVEYSPLYVGYPERCLWVDTSAFGSHFYEGNLVDRRKERTMGSFMGTAGSAFVLTPASVANHRSWLAGFAVRSFNAVLADDNGIDPNERNMLDVDESHFNNPFNGIVNPPGTTMPLKDAGHHYAESNLCHNLSTPVMLGHRCPDILLLCDAPEDPQKDFSQLRASVSFSRQRNERKCTDAYPQCVLPEIGEKYETMSDLEKLACHVFPEDFSCSSEDGRRLLSPIMIYLQGCKYTGPGGQYEDQYLDPVKDLKGNRRAENFKYRTHEFDGLAELTRKKMIDSKPQIKKAILQAVKAKKSAQG